MRWKPLFAVLLGLLMVGVTAGSASATATAANNYGPLRIKVSALSNADKTKIISLIGKNIEAFGTSKTEIFPTEIQGYKAGSYYIFAVPTSNGNIVGIYDGKSVSLSKVVKVTEDEVVTQTVTDGRVSIRSYSKSEMQKLSQPFKRITYYPLAPSPTPKEGLIQPEASFERHWWGWKITFTEQETQDIIKILEGGSATAGAVAAYLAYTGVPAGVALAVAAALIASATIIYAIDALGGHKGIYVKYLITGNTIIWHN